VADETRRPRDDDRRRPDAPMRPHRATRIRVPPREIGEPAGTGRPVTVAEAVMLIRDLPNRAGHGDSPPRPVPGKPGAHDVSGTRKAERRPEGRRSSRA